MRVRHTVVTAPARTSGRHLEFTQRECRAAEGEGGGVKKWVNAQSSHRDNAVTSTSLAHANQKSINTAPHLTSPPPRKKRQQIYIAACGIPPSSSGVPLLLAVFAGVGAKLGESSALYLLAAAAAVSGIACGSESSRGCWERPACVG